jgi:two-component system CheB/CheR fusion protein
LQSLNEQLRTVNQELKEKVDEVSRTNSDLQNLLAATDVGTIFLDRDMYIKRYTPSVQETFNIIPSDIDRPLAHLTHKLVYKGLTEDAMRVLATLTKVEREVRSTDGRWYLARLLPYRTIEDRIDGVVLTLIDVTNLRRAVGGFRVAEARLRMMETIEDYAIFSTDTKGMIASWNAGAERIFGYTEGEAVGQSSAIIFTPEDLAAGEYEKELNKALTEGRAEDERWHVRKDGSRFYASGVLSAIIDGDIQGCVKVLRDLTPRMLMEEELRRSRDEMERRVRERTRELEESYEALQGEVVERRVAESRVKELLRRIVSTQELERRRIARDIHDQLGQQMTALRLSLESLKEQSRNGGHLREHVEQLQALASQIDGDIDFLAWELRPSTLDEMGLKATVENFVQEWSKHFGIPAEFHTTGMADLRLPTEAETNLYRIAQEALNNIFKHAEASRVAVILEQRNRHAVLVIEDDGKGFDPQDETLTIKGLGLVSMRERAALSGGTLEIESTPGQGTTVFVRVPIAPANGKENA